MFAPSHRFARVSLFLLFLGAAASSAQAATGLRSERRLVKSRALINVRNLPQQSVSVAARNAFLRDSSSMVAPFCRDCLRSPDILQSIDANLWLFLDRAITSAARREIGDADGRAAVADGIRGTGRQSRRIQWMSEAPEMEALPLPEGGIPRSTDATRLSPEILAVSPASAVNFQALTQGDGIVPPDTMGAVGPNFIMTAHNDRIRISNRAGTVITTYNTHDFWAPLENTPDTPYTFSTFDPKIYFDPLTGRFIYTILANAFSPNSAVLIAISETDDPNQGWVGYGLDADATNTNWADYPSLGFNGKWVVVQVNKYTNANGGVFAGPDLYVFKKADLLAGSPTLGLTKFAGTTGVVPTEFDGDTFVPAIDAGNASPDTLWLVQQWNATNGQLRVGKITGSVGSETFVPNAQFPYSTESWSSAGRFINGDGWAPQANDSKTAVSNRHVMTNTGRIWNVVLRAGTLWCVQTVDEPAAHQNAGVVANSAAHPVNHSAVQWWHIDPSIENSQQPTIPIGRGLIEDPAATNCFDGMSAQITGCLEQGSFYAMPTIAVNNLNDVLIGFTKFNALDWPAAAYAYHDHSDSPGTFRDPAVYRPGQASYSIADFNTGRVSWGDFSATMTDPVDDRAFWTIQEYAESVTDDGGLPGWATWWAEVPPLTTSPAITCPASFSVNASTNSCDAVVSFTGLRAATASGSPAPAITYTPPSGSAFPVGVTQVTATASNDGGTASCTFSVTVVDTQVPTIACPVDQDKTAGPGAASAVVTFSFTTSDNCGPVTVTSSIPSGSGFPIGVTRVTATAMDAAHNSVSCSFNVTVRPATTVFTDDPLIPGVTVIKGIHLNEIRQEVNRMRVSAGLQAIAWSPASGVVKATDVTEIRAALAPALMAQGRTAAYSHPTLTAGTTVTAADFEELRNLTR